VGRIIQDKQPRPELSKLLDEAAGQLHRNPQLACKDESKRFYGVISRAPLQFSEFIPRYRSTFAMAY
jgi:hypothetical protein